MSKKGKTKDKEDVYNMPSGMSDVMKLRKFNFKTGSVIFGMLSGFAYGSGYKQSYGHLFAGDCIHAVKRKGTFPTLAKGYDTSEGFIQ